MKIYKPIKKIYNQAITTIVMKYYMIKNKRDVGLYLLATSGIIRSLISARIGRYIGVLFNFTEFGVGLVIGLLFTLLGCLTRFFIHKLVHNSILQLSIFIVSIIGFILFCLSFKWTIEKKIVETTIPIKT